MYCENCGAEIHDPNLSFCLSCGVPLRIKTFEFSERTNEFKEDKVKKYLYEYLDPDFIRIFVDSKRSIVWIWHGSNTTTRMKFIAAKLTPKFRDKHGKGFKIVTINEGNEPLEFKIMVGLEEERVYQRTAQDLEMIDKMAKEKLQLLKRMKETILIIINESDSLDLISKFLNLGDFDTIRCSNAEEGLRVLEEKYNDIAMIYFDPIIPGFNVEKFLQSVKSNDRYKHILIKSFIEMEKAKGLIEIIKSILKNETADDITIERQYLPEIFGADALKISKDDGLPILKLFVKFYLLSKGILTYISGNIIKLKKSSNLSRK